MSATLPGPLHPCPGRPLITLSATDIMESYDAGTLLSQDDEFLMAVATALDLAYVQSYTTDSNQTAQAVPVPAPERAALRRRIRTITEIIWDQSAPVAVGLPGAPVRHHRQSDRVRIGPD